MPVRRIRNSLSWSSISPCSKLFNIPNLLNSSRSNAYEVVLVDAYLARELPVLETSFLGVVSLPI